MSFTFNLFTLYIFAYFLFPVWTPSLSHPEGEAQRSVVGLESHWPPLLQDGLVGGMQALADRRCRVVVVVVVVVAAGWGVVVVVVVDRLVGVIVLLLPKEVGVQVPAGG